jgi:hypothetical protein
MFYTPLQAGRTTAHPKEKEASKRQALCKARLNAAT